MNKNMLKGVSAMALLLVALGNASSVLAFSTGLQTLGASRTATDVWTVNCPSGTVRLRVDVLDRLTINNPAARICVQIVNCTVS